MRFWSISSFFPEREAFARALLFFCTENKKRDAKGIPFFVQIFLRQPSIWKFCPEM